MNDLTPKIKPQVAQSLKKNIINQIKTNRKMRNNRIKKIMAAAAVVAVLVVFPIFFSIGNTAKAMNLLNESIAKTQNLSTMIIKFLVRTLPQDNFDYINLNENFVEHTILKDFSAQIWRVEKPQIAAIFDGEKSLLWHKNINELVVIEGEGGIFGELNRYLLEPQNLLQNAQILAKSKGAKVDFKENDTQIVLTIEAKAQGDFTNDYLKNSSVAESDNRQVYVFDKKTKLLQSFEIFILENAKYVSVIKTESITYNVPIDKNEILFLPKNLTQIVITDDIQNSSMTNISAKEAAEKIFNALHNKDLTPVKESFQGYSENVLKMTNLWGLEVLEIGEPFKSGEYIGEFVPYKIKLSNGRVKQHNLAIRNDNKNKVWVIDGGI